MALSMAEMRAKLQAQAKNNQRGERPAGDNASYPFWNIAEGSSATVRFLPDGDLDNEFFWRQRLIIKMPFAGVAGGEYPTNKPVTVQAPCIDMWGDKCPIKPILSKMFETKNPDKEAIARIYWPKKSYVFQGFVITSPLDEQVPANPIRRFMINQSIYDVIFAALKEAEFEDLPTDYVGGRDFKITKTRKGDYANYSSSSWSFRTRALSGEERAAIETHGLWSLKDFLGRRPDVQELAAMQAMFEDSLNGLPFDHAAYGKWFRPFGGGGRDNAQGGEEGSASQQASAAPSRSASRDVEREPVETAPIRETARAEVREAAREEAPARRSAPANEERQDTTKEDTASILARIRERQRK